jgi:hydroxymethylbilane synthase
MLPAVGQAAIAVEVRAGDDEARALVSAINDAATHRAVTAERAFLRRFGGGCRLPIGAYATCEGTRLHLRGMIAGDDGRIFAGAIDGDRDDAESIGARLAERLLTQGAAAFVDA